MVFNNNPVRDDQINYTLVSAYCIYVDLDSINYGKVSYIYCGFNLLFVGYTLYSKNNGANYCLFLFAKQTIYYIHTGTSIYVHYCKEDIK